jgi:DNA-binding MarR family transcriptional regulator
LTDKQDEEGIRSLQVALAARRLDTAFAGLHLEMAGRTGLTPHEVLALEHLGMDGPLGPTELGRRLAVTTGAVTALLDRLARRDYVRREPHPQDRRRLLVQITPKGAEDLMVHLRPMVADVVRLVRSLPREERALISRFLTDLSEIVERHSSEQRRTPPA